MGKILFSLIVLLLFAVGGKSGNLAGKSSLYKRDPALLSVHKGIVRYEKNGDVVVTIPADAMGRYRIRFFDEKAALLFEIRQIHDPLLIIEKYNFGHAGLFQYELYKDNGLVEKGSFRISP